MVNQYLINARTDKLWTSEDTSERVGVTRRTYQRWEAGTHIPTITTLKLLCIAFGDGPENPVKPEFLGYIVEKDHIRLRPSTDYLLFINQGEKPGDKLAHAHEGLLECIHKSLKLFAGIASSSEKASESDELIRSMLDILAPSLNLSSVSMSLWLTDRVSKLRIAIGRYGLRLTPQQYLAIVHAEIERWDRLTDENRQTTEEYYYTRRMALESLVLFPSSLLTAVQLSPRDDSFVEAFITQCAPCIMACSYLLKGDGDDLTTVEQMLPPYVSQLAKLAKLPSPFQKEAAYLAAQGYSLLTPIRIQQLQFDEALAHCQRVVEFAKVADDRLLIAAAFTRLGTAWTYFHKSEKCLEAYQEAERLLPQDPELFPARLRSNIYMGLSHAHAVLGHQQEAEDYLNMANQISLPLDDDPFIPILNYDLSFKILLEGKVCIKLGRLEEKKGSPENAHAWYEKAANILAQPLPESADFPEYIRVGIINRQASVAIKLGNMKDFIFFFKEGTKRSKALGSKKKVKEAMRNLRLARKEWQDEEQVIKLDEILL